MESSGFHAHSYADDLQIYAHSDPKEAYTLVASLSDCVDAIKEWMASNRLRLNPGKDGSYLAWFSTLPPPLPDDAHDHLWRNDRTIHQSLQSW